MIKIPVLLFLVVNSALADELFVKIDSLPGKADVQRSKSVLWQTGANGMYLRNNDAIRVGNGSIARLRWPDGTSSILQGGTQAKINIMPRKQKESFISHFTLLHGSAFFQLNKSNTDTRYEFRIFTQQTVLSPQASSFLLSIDKSGITKLIILRGIVEIANVNTKAVTILSAMYSAIIEKSKINKGAILTHEILSLKTWIPPSLIDEDLEVQLAESKRNKELLSGNYDDRCEIATCQDLREEKDSLLPAVLATNLYAELKAVIIRPIQISYENSNRTTPEKFPRYRLLTELANAEIMRKEQISAQGDEFATRTVAFLRVNVKLVNVADSLILFEDTFEKNEILSSDSIKLDYKSSRLELYLDQPTTKEPIERLIDKMIREISRKVADYVI